MSFFNKNYYTMIIDTVRVA